jgi:site-specific recombinase XerD
MDTSVPLNIGGGLDSGPLSPFVGRYVALVRKQGYKPTSIRYQLLLIAALNRWLERTRRRAEVVDERIIGRFLRQRLRQGRTHQGERSILHRFCSLLPMARCAAKCGPPVCSERTARIVEPYRQYLLQERGLAVHTAYAYTRWADQFLLSRFRKQPVRVRALTGRDLTDFVQRSAPRCGRAGGIHLVAALRSFCRFLHYSGHTDVNLEAGVPPVAHWALADVPNHLSAEEVEKVLAACDRDTALGRRDYAILLLLARLGLRGGEVLSMTLEDIDWDTGTITIPVTKNRRGARLPLPSDVGKAIIEYLRCDRPRCDCRRIFLRVKAPHAGLSSSPVVSTIAAKALRKAGVQSARTGAHVFRHSFATTMLGRGASLGEIGQLLRHNNPKTTAIYAKVDVETLRSIAPRWPGGAK